MTEAEILDKAKGLVTRSQTGDALNLLLQHFEETGQDDKARLVRNLSARFAQFQQEEIKGVISREQADLTRNSIQDALLNLIDLGDQPIRNEEHPKGKLPWTWIGAGAFLAVILLALFWWLQPNDSPFSLTLLFYEDSTKTTLLKTGSIQFSYQGKTENQDIDQDGKVVLTMIPSDMRGKVIKVQPELDGYNNAQQSFTIPVEEKAIEVIIQRNAIPFRGRLVADADGSPIINALVEIDMTYTDTTDAKGRFSFVLPYAAGTSKRFMVYDQSNREIYNAMEVISDKMTTISIQQ